MKPMSAATRAILAVGPLGIKKAELYDFTLKDGTALHFTTAQTALPVGGVTYETGLIITRGSITQTLGIQVDTLELTLSPQVDRPSGPLVVAGRPFLSAARAKAFDGAAVSMSKIFLSDWNDTSPGSVGAFQGRVGEIAVGRMSAVFKINSDIQLLNVAMPRNIYQPPCLHTVFDSGCALAKANFLSTGTASGTPTVQTFSSSLTQVDGYFRQGEITFTSGPNVGLTRSVKEYTRLNGAVSVFQPWPTPPVAGDAFNIYPSCMKTQLACGNTNVAAGPPFNNLVHFRGYPYVPVPETLYAGASTGPAAAPGGQGGRAGGSSDGGNRK